MPGKYENFTREQLIARLEALERRKKYGLVWEEERVREQFEKDSENAVPVLKEVKSRAVTSDPAQTAHILIEGDNYHALTVLNYTHQGKIDVIYIDPPYNTGNKDFKYNDRWVMKDDVYRHSCWLSFMEKRLKLAKKLLNPGGVIFLSIDDNEQANLKLLCDEVFNENNFIANIIWQSKTGSSDARKIDTVTEYILVYARDIDRASFSRNEGGYDVNRYRLKDEYFNERGPYYLDNLDRGGLRYSDSLNFKIRCPDSSSTYPNGRKQFFNDGWTWKWGESKIKWGLENGYVVFKKSVKKPSGWAVYYKNYLYVDNEGQPLTRGTPFKNIISDIKTGEGASVIKDIFGHHIFKYSKPVELIERLLTSVDVGSALTILDFMAGSGTTGHAVLDLNNQDGGKRQFILCTNNEENICQDICYPRLKKVIQGYKNNPALGGNLKYFKTHFIPKTANKDDLKIRVTRECTELLCLREGIFEEVTKGKVGDAFRIFEQTGRVMGIYYSLDRRDLPKLKKVLNKMNGRKIVYCFTLDPLGLDEEDFEDWEGVELKDIPQKILDIYEGLK